MEFIWDTAKAAANERKHGVDFQTASLVFSDPNRQEDYDGPHSQTEDRWIATGYGGEKILYVVYAARTGDVIRIISARKATKDERREYHRFLYGP